MVNEPVTLEQVAAAAGVSTSTASRALAGKARECRISVKTEEAILLAAQGLGFQPSHVARSLRSRKSGLIGLLVPDASNPFFAAIARKATIFAERHGMSTLLADSHDSIEHEQERRMTESSAALVFVRKHSPALKGWATSAQGLVVVPTGHCFS